MKQIKYFRGQRYYLNYIRWLRTSHNHTALSYDVWNFHHPEDSIKSKDGFVIHHINKNSADDDIDNLQKMSISQHNNLHHTDKEVCILQNGKPFNNNEYQKEYSKRFLSAKCLYVETDRKNHFQYEDYLVINKRTNKIRITHSWGYY